MQRLKAPLFAFILSASTLLCARTTHAYEPMKTAFMLDFASGIAIPISDDNYTKLADPSFKLSLRAGVVFYVSRYFGVAPELQFDYLPVNSDDGTFKQNNIDAKINRIRALAGGRFIVPFGFGSFYARVALGVDYITGDFSASAFGVTGSTSSSSTAFTVEPGVGVQFNIHRHIVVGLYMGFPIAPSHDLAITVAGFDFHHDFDAVDLDLLATIGFRF